MTEVSNAMKFSRLLLTSAGSVHPFYEGATRKRGVSKYAFSIDGSGEETLDHNVCGTPCALSAEDLEVWDHIDCIKLGEDYQEYGLSKEDHISWLCELRNRSFYEALDLTSKWCKYDY